MTPIPCRCGRSPEVNAYLRGYQHSLSCKCGTGEINFVTWSDDKEKLLDNWKSLIKQTPYKHSVQHLQAPDAKIQVYAGAIGGEDYDTDSLRRYIRATGGHCSGGGGCC